MRSCCGCRSCWGVDFVVVVGEVVISFVGMMVSCSGEKIADLNCCFGDYRIVGVVADSNIVVAVGLGTVGD